MPTSALPSSSFLLYLSLSTSLFPFSSLPLAYGVVAEHRPESMRQVATTTSAIQSTALSEGDCAVNEILPSKDPMGGA
ncbi:hypothetical protein BD309DRAFT_948028 [Dichomitus squalens]|nr:hypothetical protein BD309DRAFT_948028 [Dichomitus squalens]